jgi:hypothetical protein
MGYALKIKNVNFSENALDKVNYIEPVPCTGISIDKSALTFDKVGDTEQITATVTPSDTTDAIMWTSSDENVATVIDGLVTIHGIGTATITVTCGSQTASATINQTTIKAPYTYKTVTGKTVGSNNVTDGKILGTSTASSQSIGGQAYTNNDKLRIRGGSVNDVECIPVPYGATKVKVNSSSTSLPNYIEVVDTNAILTVDGVNYPPYIKNKDFPFSSGSYAVEYGQAFALRGTSANIESVNYVYFE